MKWWQEWSTHGLVLTSQVFFVFVPFKNLLSTADVNEPHAFLTFAPISLWLRGDGDDGSKVCSGELIQANEQAGSPRTHKIMSKPNLEDCV